MNRFKKVLLSFVLCTLALAAQAQMNSQQYQSNLGNNVQSSPLYMTYDNFDYGLCQAHDCFEDTVQQFPDTFKLVATGIDNYSLAVDVNNNFFNYQDYPVDLWVATGVQAGVSGIAVGDVNHVYAIANSCGGDPNNLHIYYLSGSNWYGDPGGGCLYQISAKGSTLMGTEHGVGWYNYNLTGWRQLPAPPSGGGWQYVSPAANDTSNDFVGASLDNTLWYYDGAFHRLLGTGTHIEIELRYGNIYSLGPESPNHVWEQNLDDVLSWGGYIQEMWHNGPWTSLATSGLSYNWAIGPVDGYGDNLFRWADQGIVSSLNLFGSCAPFCGNGAVHTYDVQGSFYTRNGATNTGHTGGSWSHAQVPAGSASYFSYDYQFNVFDCLDYPSLDACQFFGQKNAIVCTQVGQFFSNLGDGGPIPLCPPSNPCCSIDPATGKPACTYWCTKNCPPPPVKPPKPPKPKPPKPPILPLPPPCGAGSNPYRHCPFK